MATDRFVAVERMPGTGHNRPLVIPSEFLPLDRLGWLVYGGQFELRFCSSRPGAVTRNDLFAGPANLTGYGIAV